MSLKRTTYQTNVEKKYYLKQMVPNIHTYETPKLIKKLKVENIDKIKEINSKLLTN